MLNAYQVFGEKKFTGRTYQGIHRTTFVVDENGILSDVITKVKTKDHTAQILGK
jgi:peroxiredoxin Q/BCP